jgi:hypothetical protein
MIFIIREAIFGKGVVGSLYKDGELICHTLENADKLIPLGRHTLQVSYSPKFKRPLPLIYSNTIPYRRGIRIHAGNLPEESAGCVLVGAKVTGTTTAPVLTNSRETELRVTDLVGAVSGLVIASSIQQ